MLGYVTRIIAVVLVGFVFSACSDDSDGPTPAKSKREYFNGKWKPYSFKLNPADNEVVITTCESIGITVDESVHVVMLRLLFDFDPNGTVDYTSLCPGISPGTLHWELADTDQLYFAEAGMAYTVESASETEIKLTKARAASETLEVYITLKRY